MKNIGILKFFMALVIACLFMTCDPGLGKAVDTQAPKVEVKYPATKSVLKGGFTMTGVASDEVNVASCVVTFKNIKTSQEYNYNASVEKDEFKVSINSTNTNGKYELPDGDYSVTVTVSDAYRNSKADVVYTIDNTAPTVLLTSPNAYIEANWPEMYKLFTIKGEVYDATTISEVKVFVTDKDGKILAEKVADGTNTFLANFESPTIPTGTSCYYYAVAKDAGGNVNTYCYHKADIFELISSQKSNSSFPSINDIGYVDQGIENNFNESVTQALLSNKKLQNNKTGLSKGTYPGFDYYDKDTAQIKWLNISEDSPAGIGIGSPVLGTIMPPTDGSAIILDKVEVYLVKSADGGNTFPEFPTSNFDTWADGVTKWILEAGTAKQGDANEKQVKLSSVGDSVNFQVDSHPVGVFDNWTSSTYKIKIKFVTNSQMEGTRECAFTVTSGAPKLTEGVFAEGKGNDSYYRGFMTAKTLESGKNMLSGISKTSDGSGSVPLKYVITGEITDSQNANVDGNGDYTIEVPIADDGSKDGEYTYTLTAEAGTLSTVISRVVVIDTLNPVVEFSNLANDDILENDEFIVKGNIDDANGISKVEYQLIENGGSAEWKEISNAKSSFNLQLSSLKENVTYTLKIRATDVAGNISGDDDYKCNFTIDLANPIATIDNPLPETGSSIYFTNEIPVFEGKASDDSKTAGKLAKTAILSYSKDGVAKGNIPAGTSEGQFNWNQAEGTWTWNATESQFDGTGKYDVKLVVTDDSGKTTEDTLTVSLDVTPPSIKLTQVSPYVEREDVSNGDAKYYVNGDITVKFDITENDYIKSIDWYKIDGTKDSQDLGTNAQPTVKVKTTDFADGKKLSEFKLVVTDRSGNTATYTGNETELVNYEINQDSDNPTIDIAGINPEITTEAGISANNNLFSTSDSISITLKDDDGVASGTYQIDGNSEKTINGGNAKVKTETISLNGLNQGPHTIELSVRDTNGKEVSTKTIYFGIDDKAPDLTIDGYSGTDIDAGFKNADFNITGTASDSYEFKQLICNYVDLDASKEIALNGTNWTLPIEKPNSSEKKTIRFVASDKFSRTTIKTFTYIFDLDKPNLIINDVQKENITDKYFNQNSILTLSGTANDLVGDTATQSGLKFVQYAIGEGHNADSVNSDGWQNANGSTDWTVLLNIPKYQDGQYTLLVKAIDNSNNESEVQKFNITADSVSPILTEGGSADASGTSYASGTLNLQGTVSDSNLDTITYSYSLNGNNQELDVPISPVGNSAEKTWSITKSDLGDGTHIFKIIATDKAGNSSVITRNIIIDKTAPEITKNVSPQIMYNNGNGEELTVNGTIDVNIRVAETNKLKGVYYTENTTLADDAEWSGVTGVTSFNETELSTGKTISVDTTRFADKSTLPLRIKAVDEAGNYSVVYVNPVINQESDKPGFVPSNFVELNNENAAGWKAGTSYNVFSSSSGNLIFTLSDDDSVKEYFVKVDNGDFVKISEINSTQKIVSYSLENLIKNGNYGRHTITFIVKDVNYADNLSTENNFVEKTYYIAIDDGQPSLIISNANNQYVGNNFTISGSVEDANGVEKVTIAPLTGSSFTPIEITSFTDGNDGDKIFTYNFAVPTERVPLVITAVDSIGNESVKELTYLVDNVAPIIRITSGDSAYVDGDYPSLRITGMAEDGDLSDSNNSGIDQVRIKIESDITGVNDSDSILALGKIDDGNMSWSSSIDFTGKSAGSYTVYVKAFDLAGNASTSSTITVYVDTDKPKLNHGYVDNFVGNYKGNFVITGTATDASGVKSVTAKIQGATNNLVGTYAKTSDSSESIWSFNIPANVGDGQLTILVTALDGCGKSVQETFTATLDTVAPSVTFTDISDDDHNNTTIETSKTTDKPRVSVTYADSTSGVKNIDYTFYYYDPNGNISGLTPDADGFIDYSDVDEDASGSFTISKFFSGTVVMRMAETTGSKGAFINTETNTDGIWYVKVKVTDEAENSAEYDSPYFYVDQHKPELKVTSPAETVTLKKNGDSLTVAGTTSDGFGGEIDRVEIRVEHPDYKPEEVTKFTKTFDVNATSFDFNFTFDTSPFIYPDVYEIFVTSYDKAGNQRDYSKRISCDNTAPTITFARPYSYSVDSDGNETIGNVVNSPIGDTNIKATANDYSMDSIYYQIGGTVTIDESEGIFGESGYKINKLTIRDGALTTDNYGNSVNNPTSDKLAEGIVNGTWNKLKDANLDFDVTYNTLTLVNGGFSYHASGDKDTIQTLDVHIVSVDTAGNVNYCKFPLKVDTDTDKPVLMMLSPKTIGDVANVGGTATISGTVNDDNAVHSVWMQVELVNGNYVDNILTGNSSTFGIDYTSYGISNPQNIVDAKSNSDVQDTAYFSDRTQWYKVNIGEQGKSTTWNMVLNKSKEFDNVNLFNDGYLKSEVEQTELIVRVKALDTKSGTATVSDDAKEGDVTEFTLKIDSGSPSIIIKNISDFKEEGSYIGGDLVFDIDFTDDESITEWKIEAISTLNGDNRSYVIGSDKAGSYDVGFGPSVDKKITVSTQDIYEACGNLIQIIITAKDNSKGDSGNSEQPKESSITFKYTIDNTSPHANYVSTIDSVKYHLDTEAVGSGANRESNARGNHLRIISEQAALKGNVLDETNGSSVDFVMVYFTKEISGTTYLYNPSKMNSKTAISTTCNIKDYEDSSSSRLFPVKDFGDIVRTAKIDGSTPYIIVDRAEGWDDDGANGDFDGYSENLKANGEWVVYFNSTNLPDSLYDIHYVVVDYAGNARYYSDTMLVQNNPPTINSIVLATDIDGDGYVTSSTDGTSDEDDLFNSSSYINSGFMVRNSKLTLQVNATGGTGTKKYYLTYPVDGGKIEVNNTTGIFEITTFPKDKEELEENEQYVVPKYVVWVEDSVEQNLSLSSGETTIEMIMDNKDSVAPVAQLFELNTFVEDSATSSEERGSLYKEDSAVQGHIEPRDNSRFDNGNGQDPDVSGKIILRGEVMDNQRIGSIKLVLNVDEIENEIEIATWNDSTDTLETQNANITSTLGLKGHHVEWSYVWDTNGFAAKNVDVAVKVLDASNNPNVTSGYLSTENIPHSAENMFSGDNWGYNSMTVDVVPYITGLGTTLSRIEKRNPSVYGRSTLGKYPVYYYRKTVSEGKESEEITVEGFNILSGSTVTFEGGATTSLDVNKVFTLPENAKSGKIFVTVSEVPSLNNANDNGAVGSSGEYYNQKPNGQNNDLLTDDIELLIWEINSKAAISESGELSEVMMHVNPSNGMLGFAFAHSQDLASYPNGNNNSYETWITDWTGVNQISFVYDKNGNMFGTNGGTDTYTPNKKVGRLGLISSHWGVITNTSASNDWYSGYTKYRRLRLEYLGLLRNNAYASNVYRFAKGDAIQLATTYSETSGTNLYMLYYDNTLGELKFKAGNFDSHEGAIYNSASGDKWTKSDLFFGDFSDDAHYEKASDSSNNYEPTYKTISIVANQNGANGDSYVRPGIYYSVDAISSSDGKSDVVVAVWYDDVNKTLWYSYLVNPLANAGKRDANGAISTEWATPIAILDGHAGGYCAIKVDDAGHIHIAAYSRNDAGSLYYAYLNSYDADYNENENLVAVDAYGSTGQYITMEVAKDGKGKYIPYIGYYMSSMSYPKYAYLVDTESAKVGGTYYPKPGVDENSMFTGAWETVLLPTTSTIVIDDINIGVYKNSDGTLKSIPKQTESVGVKNGIAGGNDTSNPIFAYGISQTGSGYIETAQLK